VALTPSAVGYGGFWRRVVASIIDGVLLEAVFIPWSRWGSDVLYPIVFLGQGRCDAGGCSYSASDVAVVSLVVNAVVSLVAVAYFVVLWSAGGTIGQRIVGLRVVRENGRPPNLVRSVLRYVGLVISVAAVFIGLVWVAFDPRKQGWHDKLAGTFVVRG